jgi:superoxide dismutase, Cu-Zn family
MGRTPLVVALIAIFLSGYACKQTNTSQQPADVAKAPAATDTHEGEAQQMEGFAIALAPTKGSSTTGTVMLMPMGDGVHVSGVISGLTPGKHGIHIHEKGDCSAPDATSAGGHFNPAGANHGAPDTLPHHAGDLGNLIAGADGRAEINVHANGISLQPGANSISGRAMIVHAGEDDFNTQPTGNAGGRVACGVIQAAN